MDKARVKNKDLLCYEMERKVKIHRVREIKKEREREKKTKTKTKNEKPES